MVEKKSSVYATEGKLTAIADAATKREKERKASLAAAGVKDINAYDNAYAPLKNFEKDVNSLYNEINSLGKHHAASDTQLGNVRKNAEGMVSRIGSINSFLDTYGNLYDKNSIAEMRSGLSEISKGLSGWLDQSGAEDYLTKLNATNTIDTASVAKAIKDKESEIVRAQRGGRDDTKLKEELNAIYEGGGSYGQAAKRRSEYAANKLALEQKKKEAAELGTKIGQSETADEGTASRVQTLYAEIKDLEDKISTYEKVIAPSDDAWLEVFGGGNDLSEYKGVEYTAAEDPVRFLSGGKDERKLADTSSTITDDERVVYNYLLKNKGVNAAKAWLRSYAVEDERNQRYGQALGEKYNDIDSRFWRATALIPLSGLVGLEQYATGVASLATPLSSKKPTSALAYAQQEATKDLGKVGKAINDATVAIGNMVPSIAIGAINPVAGQISFGASAAGNAYNEARKEGKSIGEAAMYGLVSGGSELVLQRFLGGIPVLSGGANKLVTAAKNLKNPAIRALSVYGLNALSEGTEEYIQDILDPVFRNVFFQEDNEVKILSGDAAYSFLLGAISAGVLNIPSLARSIPVSRFGNGINVSGHTQNLIDNALKLPKDSEAYDLASKLKSGELKASDENVGEFAKAFARDGGDLSFLYERSGTVEEMAQKGNIVAEPIAEVKIEEKPASEAQTIVDGIVADGEITNSKAERIMDNAEALEIIGANTEGLGSKSQKRAVIKEALRNYQQQTVAQRLANEVAQSTANFAADVQKAKAEQTDANTPSEAPAENATTYRYQYDVDKQRLGTRIIKDLGNTSAGGVKLSERLAEIATSVTGDKDANRAVYKLFANPRYAMMAGVEHTEDMRNIIRNIKDSANSNFARRQMSNYIASTAAITEWTDLIRKDSNGVSLDKAAAMAPSNGKNAPDGYFDESEHAVVLNDGLVTYKRIISTLVHEGFHADGSIDRALVNNFSRYLENKWGKKDWDATVKDKKAKIEAYDGRPTTTVKAEEEVCAQVISELFNKPSAWEAMGEMFGEVEGSDRFVNRMKATVKRIFDNFRKKFGADIPNGKLTTFRDFLDTLLVKTQKGYTSVNETAKAPAKKETKAETKAATETKAQPEAAEEIDLDEDVDEAVDEDYYEGLTDEEREAVDLADELLDGETKKTADGGRVYSSEDTEVDTTKISAEMSDMEREKILRGKTLVTPIYDAINDKTIEAEKESLSSKEKTLVKSALIRLGKEFSVAGDYKNRDLEVEISISNGTLKKTSTAAASVEQVARLLPHLQESVENAIAIEAHRNRYFHDANTIYFYEMISGYVDGEDFVPVRFGVKMSEDRNKLYVVVDGEKIKAEVIKSTMPQKEGTLDSRSAYAISLPRLFANVNSSEILKYVPDGFLSEMQKEAKYFALSEMVKHTNNKNDTHYKEALASGNAREVSRLANAAAKYYGYTIKGYHGTSRADRVGNVFRPDRATSGPMAFFTDDKEVANNYARDKKDTSLAYDSEYDSYYTQFRVNRNGKNISVPELWNYLSFSEKNAIKEKAKHIKFDDDYENIIVDTSAEHGNGAWDAYTLNMHRGNALEALVDTWLETGDLYNREVDFLQVLDLVGIKGVEYRDPDARYEKTYETWLKIQKPFDTDNANQSFYDSLSEWIENHDMSVYERETSNADFWDKNNQTPESWLEKLSHDIENGTTNAWTVIPDFVTDYLKEQGYDGIKDKGGKGGGAGHTVWIPFSSNQIKSADPITYDDNGNIIPLSERFNNESNDIRYSAEDTDVATPETPLATVNDFNAEVNRIYREGKAAGKTDDEIGKEVDELAKVRNAELREVFGTIEPGEKAAREFAVPKKTEDGKKVSQSTRTVGEAGATPETMLPTLEAMIANGTFSYEPLSNKKLVEKAKNKIGTTQDSFNAALKMWMEDGKLVTPDQMVMGWILYDAANKRGEQDTATEICVNIISKARVLGQGLQAMRILKMLTPAGQIAAAKRVAENFNNQLEKEGRKPRERYTDEELATVDNARKQGKRYTDGRITSAFRNLSKNDVPVEEWAKEIGNIVAGAISKRLEPLNSKDRLVSRTVANDLLRFAENYALPKKQGTNNNRTAAERVADFFANRDQYIEAWNQARDVLREQYKDSPDKLDILEAFLNGTVDYNGEGSDALMMQAVSEAALSNDVKMQDIMRRAALGDINAVTEEIFNRLQETVKAEGSDVKILHDAVRRWVMEKYLLLHPLTQKQIDAVIRKKMVKLGKSMDYVIRQDRTQKGEMLQQITAMLVNEFGVSPEAASDAAIKIKERYDTILEKASKAALERAVKERKPAQRKTLDELFANYANMGAFTSDYDEAIAKKLFKETVHVNQGLIEAFLSANTDDARDNALMAIYKDIGSQLPATYADKYHAWCFLAMLGNLKTHIRNIRGNVGMVPMVLTKDVIATTIEYAAERATKGKFQASKGFVVPGEKLTIAAWKDYERIQSTLKSRSKYDDRSVNNAIEEGRVIFEKFKNVEYARKLNSELLEGEDLLFMQSHYAFALAQYCKAKGISAKDIETGDIPDAARDYAFKEAEKATFKDRNEVSDFLSKLHVDEKRFPKIAPPANWLIEGVMPFKRTPANILVRGVEYSPIWTVKGVYDLCSKVSKGDMSATEAIDELSSGLTGTMVMLLGMFLSRMGIVVASGADDEKERKFHELWGHQSYSLVVGGKSYTIDWLAPIALPFFVGVELQSLASKRHNGVKLYDIKESVLRIADPMLELSCLQSINNALDDVAYAREQGSKGITEFAVSLATSRFMQMFPTSFGQLERTFENKRMTTFTEKDSFLSTDTQYLIGKISARLPGDYQQIPYIDAWGRIEETGPLWERAYNNFINPSYVSEIKVSAMEHELQRLKESTGETSVYPSRANKKVTVSKEVDGERKSEEYHLSAEDYVQYATAKGNIAYNAITNFMSGEVYKGFNDTERVDAIEKIYSYAEQYARTLITDHEPEGWIADALKAQKEGMSFDTFFEAYIAQSSIKADRDFLGNVVSGSAADKKKAIIDSVTTNERERKLLYGYLDVGKTAQNNGIMASIVDAAIRKDDAAYEKATQDYFDNNEGAKTSDLNAAKFKYIEAEMMRLAKLSYDDPAKYETEVARYRNGKNSVIAARFTEANMRAARNRWINDYTEELAEKLAKNANDSDKVKLIYAEAAKYGIDKAKLDARARKYANKK